MESTNSVGAPDLLFFTATGQASSPSACVLHVAPEVFYVPVSTEDQPWKKIGEHFEFSLRVT
jgi:hypothetical protein